ncbi:hypothetical protein B0T17DRAFT_296653 [Bombardia bombarda]|uniref:Uncharacterized protein n=1 Tax=Bombardia bombarda TaxID=252184 RepID=A0AA40C1S2_9PEZI|nr:hypothetical protein B0T17DRAFT_296653 [Bombardia bombarda]
MSTRVPARLSSHCLACMCPRSSRLVISSKERAVESYHEYRTQQTDQEDCARHRFIVWAAVKRNSSPRMTAEDRLKCPLHRCRQRFLNHEAMLSHLSACIYLPSGEYYCYDHMRVERFDDIKCKRCLGHPSKRRKMLSMAKNFFHSLGQKSKKGSGMEIDVEDASMMPPPPYHSLSSFNGGNPTELSSNEIVEIDSVEVTAGFPTVSSHDGGLVNPQDLVAPVLPSLPELDSAVPSNDLFMEWQPTPIITTPSFPFTRQEDGEAQSLGPRPTLQVNTYGLQGRPNAPKPVLRPAPVVPRSKGLSPSSSVRSTASTDTNASTVSTGSSMISPVSNWSGAWSMGSGLNTTLTSPVDGLLAEDPFADAINTYNNAGHDSLFNHCSELPAELPADFPTDFVPQFPADFTTDFTTAFASSKTVDDATSDTLFPFDLQPLINFSYPTDLVLTDNPTTLTNAEEPEEHETDPPCSETTLLASTAWDALSEHIFSSNVKIQDIRENPLAPQLNSMSLRTIATAGIRTLSTLVNGGQPSSATDTICFIHLVYAFSLALHEQGASNISKDLFLQALSYVHSLPQEDRLTYTQLAREIWQPPDITQREIETYFSFKSSRNPSQILKGKFPETACGDADILLDTARNFLDELEISMLLGRISDSAAIQKSGLYNKHIEDTNPVAAVHQAFSITVTYVFSMLSQDFSDQGFKDRLNEILQRVSDGTISSVRRVEIEVLHAGKRCMSPATFFDEFVTKVRNLCDPIYQQHDAAGTSRRNVYHNFGIELFENLIPEFDQPVGNIPDSLLDEPEDMEEFIQRYTSDLTSSIASSVFEIPSPASLSSIATGFQISGIKTTPSAPPPPPLPNVTSSSSSSSSAMSSPMTSGGQRAQAAQSEDTTSDHEQEHDQAGGGPRVEADSCCDICGYRPKGDPQWFKGSMAKHKKLQHSAAPPKIYKCPYPGCSSQYKNRPDNLRQHQIDKNHWGAGEEANTRRPSKRKKVAMEDE